MIKLNPQRKHLRLEGYDYALPGGYFVTMAANQRGNIFGLVEDLEVTLNNLGKMVRDCWEETPERFPVVLLDEFILRPDHIHAILFIEGSNVGAGLDPARIDPNKLEVKPRATSRVAPTLGQIIGALKSISTMRYYSGINDRKWTTHEGKLWQRGYHDRIIRNKSELNRILHYVINNAVKQEQLEIFNQV